MLQDFRDAYPRFPPIRVSMGSSEGVEFISLA